MTFPQMPVCGEVHPDYENLRCILPVGHVERHKTYRADEGVPFISIETRWDIDPERPSPPSDAASVEEKIDLAINLALEAGGYYEVAASGSQGSMSAGTVKEREARVILDALIEAVRAEEQQKARAEYGVCDGAPTPSTCDCPKCCRVLIDQIDAQNVKLQAQIAALTKERDRQREDYKKLELVALQRTDEIAMLREQFRTKEIANDYWQGRAEAAEASCDTLTRQLREKDHEG